MADPSLPYSASKATALLLAAAVAAPLLMLLGTGFLSYDQIKSDAERRVVRTAQAVAEHALRTFRAHDLVITSVANYIDGWEWGRIARSRPLHEYLLQLASAAPDVSTIFVLAPSGLDGASSVRFPLAPIDLAGGNYFRLQRPRTNC